jgi:hypothetical protein
VKPKGYLVFHLNIGFSSIELSSRLDVINKCYHPLLDLIEKTNIPIGIELTGSTLLEIEELDISWVKRFKKLLNSDSCELIGSGYSQIIGPLVPYTVNEWNQKLGLDTYVKVLGTRPEIVLVNEMAFSSSLVDLYKKFEFEAFIMDRVNIKLALDSEDVPTHAIGENNSVMPVLWSDSFLFQKVQHFAHGDIRIRDYIKYLDSCVKNGESLLPIYCNDAECFDYRPGRFNEEKPTHPEGEWRRIERLLEAIKTETKIQFISPSEALKIIKKSNIKRESKLASASYPIPVKKQNKYNIARWAVTGRDDLWLNTMCHRVEEKLTQSKNNNTDDWRNLCEFWSSDLRTHITNKRWAESKEKLILELQKYKLSDDFFNHIELHQDDFEVVDGVNQIGDFKISKDDEGVILGISSKNINIELNLMKGLAIQNLAFKSHNMEACIGTLAHGHFSNITLGADFFSGVAVIELPLLRQRITDLERVQPKILLKKSGSLLVVAEIKSKFGIILTEIEVSDKFEKIKLSYNFKNWEKVYSVARLGAVTLINQFSNQNTKMICLNGGRSKECYSLIGEFNHSSPASTLVSSSRGLGATNGEIQFLNKNKSILLKWSPSECAAMPMLQNIPMGNKSLSRLFFSTHEMDDTVKEPNTIKPFSVSISTY